MSTRVFTLPGAYGAQSSMPGQLGGAVCAGNTVVPVDYQNATPNWKGPEVVAAVNTLDNALATAINNSDDQLVVLGHSLGAVVASRWLKIKGASRAAWAPRVRFVLIGNSVRRYGGVLFEEAIAAPADTPFTVLDIANQYDGWSDFPTLVDVPDLTNVDFGQVMAFMANLMTNPAAQNALAGANTGRHDYHGTLLNDPRATKYVQGNITYVLSPTDKMPGLFATRSVVEGFYARPMPATLPASASPTSNIDPKTLNGDFTSELRMHLLERRWGYLHRRTKKPLVRLWDKEWRFIARVENLDKWDWEELATDDGEAHITFSGKVNDWLREIVTYQIGEDEDIHLTVDPDPDKPHDWKTRWGGKVLTVEDDDNAGEASTTTLSCISNRRHLKGIYLAANPIFPAEVQLPKMFLWGGGTASTCATATFVNCFRLFSLNGFYPIPRNIFAPETWLQNLSPLNWPVQVMPINPLLDQSRWCTIGARWKDAHTILSPVMKDATVICRAYTWLPGDAAPYTMFGPELAEILKPTRACTILSFEDVSGVTGPTGTMLDGALNLFAATLDDLITETFIPYDDPTVEEFETDPFFRKLLLVAPKPPPFVYRDVGYGNVNKAKKVIHKSQATDIIVGGKSPQWLNMAITFAIRWGISQLANVISLGPAGAAQAPGSEGLDNLYQGQLDDVFLAFQRFINPLRSAKVGSYAFREYFHQGHGSAYTINAIQDLAAGERAMKAYTSLKFDVTDGQPYVYGEDYWLGDRAGAEIRGVTWIDNILAVRAEGNRESAGRVVVSFGADEREEDPIARGFRTISNVANFAGLLAGSGDLF